MKQTRGTQHIHDVAKEIMTIALPIQCVEAVFLGCYWTQTLLNVVRVPINFKSRLGQHVHRHIVLGTAMTANEHHAVVWGSLGISRRNNLMWKEPVYSSLFDLILEFKRSYETHRHVLLEVYIGLPLPHQLLPDQPVKWKAVRIPINGEDVACIEAELGAYEAFLLGSTV